MAAPKITTSICVSCGDKFDFTYSGGRRRRTCSERCKAIRDRKNRRALRKRAKQGSDAPWNRRRPSIGDRNYRAITQAELSEIAARSKAIWESKRLRRAPVENRDWAELDTPTVAGWIPRVSPHAGGITFVADDYFDAQRDPLRLIPAAQRQSSSAWLARNRFEAGWKVGQTSKHHLPVIGSDQAVPQKVSPHHLRDCFYPTHRYPETGGQPYLKPLKPFSTVYARQTPDCPINA